jgi:uncharacterized integral membrane protein
MNSELWIGTAISIPIGIASGLAVAPIQRWMDRWGETTHQKKKSRMKDEYAEVTDSALHPEMMIAGMITSVLLLGLDGFVLLLLLLMKPFFDGFLSFVPRPAIAASHLPEILVLLSVFMVGSFFALTILAFRMVMNSVRLYWHVRFFREYVKSIPDELRDLKLEKIVICANQDRAYPGLYVLRSELLDHPEESKQDDGLGAGQNTDVHTLTVPSAK